VSEPRIELYDPPADNIRVEISVAEIRAEDFTAFRRGVEQLAHRYSQWGMSFSVGAPRQRSRVVYDAPACQYTHAHTRQWCGNDSCRDS
jgi:hypothetical protein